MRPKTPKPHEGADQWNRRDSAAARQRDAKSAPIFFASSDFRAIALEGGSEFYAEIEAVAASVERDERMIKERLISLAECGDTGSIIRILREWESKPPREVLETCVEPDNGNGG